MSVIEKELLKHSIFLSQRLSEKKKYLKDYALNKRYRELCRLRLVARLLNIENEPFIKFVEKAILEVGESEGIQELDNLSRIGIATGHKRKVIKL